MSNRRKRPRRPDPVSARAATSKARAATAAAGPSPVLVCLLLAAATFGVHAAALSNGFVSYDDELYVLRNPHVSSGLSFANVAWAFVSREAANWHPLTWISHMADVSLWGLRPAGHHLTSILLHVANVLLVFLLLRGATRSTGRSAAAALLFALHPLRVESVAWVAERKDVLSAFFGLAAIGAWGVWAKRRDSRLYTASLALFAASLMSKATFVTLPVLLLVADFWPLRRLFAGAGAGGTGAVGPRGGGEASTGRSTPAGGVGHPAPAAASAWARSAASRRLLLEKAPFLLLSIAAGLITLGAQRSGGATEALTIPLGPRLENAVVAAVRYLGKTLWPADLAVLYPHAAASLGWKTWAAAALLAAISAGALAAAKRRPYLIAGWAWYLVALLPVIGIVQVGWQAIADRYTYVPSLGIAVAVVWGVAEAASGRVPARVLAIATAAVLVILSVLTVRQIGTWRDSLALYEHAIAVTGPNETMEIDLGNELARRGRTEDAASHFTEALGVAPGSKDALYALGTLALAKGRYSEARDRFSEAARLHPDFAEAEIQTAVSYIRESRPAEAIPHAARASFMRPGMPDALYVLATALDAQGRTAEAIEKYEEAIASKPDYAEAHENLGELLMSTGRAADAIPHFEAALRAKPDFAEARQALDAARKRVR